MPMKRPPYTSCVFFSCDELGKKEKEQDKDIWFWQYLSWHLMPVLEGANGERSQCQRNMSRQKELLRNQSKLQTYPDKWLGTSPPIDQKPVARFLLRSTQVGTDLACVWDAQTPRETWVFVCKQSCILILHAPVLAQDVVSRIPPESWWNQNA